MDSEINVQLHSGCDQDITAEFCKYMEIAVHLNHIFKLWNRFSKCKPGQTIAENIKYMYSEFDRSLLKITICITCFK